MRQVQTRTDVVCAHQSASLLESLEPRQLLAFTALIDFQPSGVPTQSGYKADKGAVFGDRGNGLTYGWNATNNNGTDRNNKRSFNQAYDTFLHTQKNGNFTWEIALPNGTYDVRPIAGDASAVDSFYHFLAEGQTIISGRPSSPYQHWVGGNMPINVTDGRLTISNGPNAVNNKLALIEIRKAAPTLPSGLTASTVSSSSIQLNWKDNAINEDGFIVERNHTSNLWERVATLPANATSFLDTGLSPNTRYAYRIKAFNDAGQSQASGVASATTPSVPGLAPAAPTNLVASAGGNMAALTWTDNSDNEEKFIVQIPDWNGGWRTYTELPANTTTTNVFLRSASINQFRVVARNTAGGNSTASNVVSIATKPEPPSYAGAQAVSSTAIDVFWDSIDSCQFHLEKLIDGQWVRIASDLLSLNYRDTGLAPGTTHSYRVISVAANSAGDSDPSDVVSATTAPAAVTGLAVTNTTATSVSLAWNDVAGEAGYSVERSLDGVNWTTVTFLFPGTTTYTNTGLQSAKTYFFRVTGFAYGPVMGDRSDPVTATTL
jgi:hypothetical protein